MIARLLICPDINSSREQIQKMLASRLTSSETNHPDLLLVRAGEKLGIAEAKKIKEFFSFKPYSAQGKIVVLEDASTLTHEAQNALLKTMEELPVEATLILAAGSDANLLPTILSRCEIIKLTAATYEKQLYHSDNIKNLERLLHSSLEERFGYIEKLKEKEEFLRTLVYFFRQKVIDPVTLAKSDQARPDKIKFLKELLRTEEWAKQNVNIRAILEYLMLVMPKTEPKNQ